MEIRKQNSYKNFSNPFKTTEDLEKRSKEIERTLNEWEGKPIWVAPGTVGRLKKEKEDLDREIEKRKGPKVKEHEIVCESRDFGLGM